jgi:hypothetical protein
MIKLKNYFINLACRNRRFVSLDESVWCFSSDRSVTVNNLVHCEVDEDGGGLFIIFSRLILPTTNYTTTKCSVMEKQKQQPL